jgi:hypothetical protein
MAAAVGCDECGAGSVGLSGRIGELFLDVRGDPGVEVRWLEEDFRKAGRVGVEADPSLVNTADALLVPPAPFMGLLGGSAISA